MRARTIIKEGLDFERGKDPKSTIGIGMREIIANEMRKQNRGWEYENDRNALCWTILHGDPEHAKWLIENGEGLILKPPKPGELRCDPLQYAAKGGLLDIVELLLAKGFRTSYKTIDAIMGSICWSDSGETYFKITELILKTHKFSAYRYQMLLQYALQNKRSVDNSTMENSRISKLVVMIAEYLEEASKGLKESINFERGKDVKNTLRIGLRYKKDLKKGDIFLVWNKNKKDWERMEAMNDSNMEYYTTYETPDLFVNAKKEEGSWLLEASCIWNIKKRRWEFLNQLKIKESVNFERGKDPKEVMGLGIEQQIENFLKSVDQSTSNIDHKLKICARYGKVPFVEYLISKGADPRAQGDIALTMAINRNDVLMAETLIKAGSRIETRWISKHRRKKRSPGMKDLLAKYGMDLHESVNFERGKDIIDTMKLGIRNSLQTRRIGFSLDQSRITPAILRIWKDIEAALDEDSPENIFFLGRPDSSSEKLPVIPREIATKIYDYVFTDEAIKKSSIFDKGTGNKYQLFETPWGKILKETSWGITHNYYVNYETAKALGLHKYPILNESQNFERGKDPLKAMGIGVEAQYQKIRDRIEEENLRNNYYKPVDEGIFRGIPYIIFQDTFKENDEPDGPIPFVGVYIKDDTIMDTQWALSIEEAIVFLKDKISKEISLSQLSPYNESLSFERGKDPKSSMGIGVYQKIRDGIEFIVNHHDVHNANFERDTMYGGADFMIDTVLKRDDIKRLVKKTFGDILIPMGTMEYLWKTFRVKPDLIDTFEKAWNDVVKSL